MPKAILLQRKTPSFTFLTAAKFNFKHLNTLFINTLPKAAKFFRFSVKVSNRDRHGHSWSLKRIMVFVFLYKRTGVCPNI